jgi:hypothetical protein
MLRRFIAQMVTNVLPSHHPLAQICYLIGLLEADDFKLLPIQTYHYVADTFARELGAFHCRAVDCRVEVISRFNQCDLLGAGKKLRKLLLECEEFCSSLDWRSKKAVLVVWLLFDQGRCAEAEAVGNYALQYALR